MRQQSRGIRIAAVQRGAPAWRCGIRVGDVVLSVNGERVRDELDFSFLCASDYVGIEVERRGKRLDLELTREGGEYLGAEVQPPSVRKCANRCIFCFVDQMPRGLRKSLYVKDEDVRHSFLNGNYVTISSARPADLERIMRMHLSPLYVSVHASNRQIRNVMLGSPRAPDILDQIRTLTDGGIRLHTQIVVCPGYNDGTVLGRTIQDLLGIGENIESIAVVPVGITRFRACALRPVDRDGALEMCRRADEMGELDCRTSGRRRVFSADELYIRAGAPIPPRRYYEDFPQIENGVGLVRQLLDAWRATRQTRAGRAGGKRPAPPALVVTGASAFPFVKKVVDDLSGSRDEVVCVENRFFGATVTVAGLLTARDVVAAVRRTKTAARRVVVPAVMFNYRGSTLDGWTLQRMQRALGKKVIAASSPEDLVAVS